MGAIVHFDALASQALRGRIEAAGPSDGFAVALRLGQRTIATSRSEPIGDSSADRNWHGFDLPFAAGAAYAALVARGSLADLTVACADRTVPATDIDAAAGAMQSCGCLTLHEFVAARVTDLWFATGSQLRLRMHAVSSVESSPLVLDFYQCDIAGGEPAAAIASHRLDRAGISFISVDLLNPFLPLLIAVSEGGAGTRLLDILPYPSLCQGGDHFAELQALAMTGSYLDSLRTTSGALLKEHLGWPGAPGRSIGKVLVDVAGPSASEPTLSSNMRAWLGQLFDVAAGPSDPSRPGDEPPAERLTLHLPANSLPSLTSLTTRRLRLKADQERQSGSFVIAEPASRAPVAVVSLPPLPPWLGVLRPDGPSLTFPIVSRGAVSASEEELAPLATDIPLAVTAAGARGRGHGQAASAALAETGPVSIVISFIDGRLGDLANLVNSLRMQSVHERLEVIVVGHRIPAGLEAAARELLGLAFPGRFQIVECTVPFNASAQLNAGATHARGETLVFASDTAVLTQPTTLEMLAALAAQPNVASASCVLMGEAKDGTGFDFVSAGLFPVEASLIGRPFVRFDGIDCRDMLPDSVYPVAATDLALCAVRAATWQALGGLDEALFPHEGNGLDYGLRALAMGYLHLCTTAATASCGRRPASGPARDVLSSRYLTRFPLDRLLERCTIIRRLDR